MLAGNGGESRWVYFLVVIRTHDRELDLRLVVFDRDRARDRERDLRCLGAADRDRDLRLVAFDRDRFAGAPPKLQTCVSIMYKVVCNSSNFGSASTTSCTPSTSK